MPRPSAGPPPPRFSVRDATAEAVAGIVQRPGRSGLTMLGTVLGVGAFVAVLGLTATGAGQISRQFSVLEDTTVTVADNGPANDVAPPGTYPAPGFPAGADAIADHIHGVVAAGVWWPVALPQGTNFSASEALSGVTSQTVNLLAASPGAVRAMVLTMVAGSSLSTYENDTAQHVAMLNTTTAATLGISAARLPSHPAVFVNGIAYTVVGIYSTAQRVVSGDSGMLIPEKTALADYGNPEAGIGTYEEAQMVIATKTGAAQEVAREIAAAELPTDPHRLVVTPPQSPLKLQGEVNGDLAGLFLILALMSRPATKSSSSAPTSRHSTPGSGSTRPRSPASSRPCPPCCRRHRPRPTCPARAGPATTARAVRPSPRPATPDGRAHAPIGVVIMTSAEL